MIHRIIKFRGKDLFDNWQYGSLLLENRSSDETCEVRDIITLDGKRHPCKNIGQFTGLYDINNKEIFEGDIICSYDSKQQPIIHRVEYDNDEATFVVVLNGSKKGYFGYGKFNKEWINECKKIVIGNIYDNPEIISSNY